MDVQETLLKDQTAAADGQWVNVARVGARSAHVKFAGAPGTDTVELRGHNGKAGAFNELPANSDHGVLLGSAVTAQESLVNLDFAVVPYCRYVKAKKTGTAVSVTVVFGGMQNIHD